MKTPIKLALSAVLVLCSVAIASAQSPVVGPPWQKVVHNTGTIAFGGTAQTVAWTLIQPNGAALPNVIRCIQNPGSATEDLFVSMDATASPTHGFDLVPGIGQCYFWANTVSVEAATTSHTFLITELQWGSP